MIDGLIEQAKPYIREIVFHSDGRIATKTHGKAPHPKRLYTAKTLAEALKKLIKDNTIT